MRKLSLSKSRTKAEKAEGDTLPSPLPSPKSSSAKKLPGKLTKGLKRQLWKLDEIFHHVTHTTHQHRAHSPTTTDIARTIVPSSPSSSRSSKTWDIKYVREVDLQSIERASISSGALSIDPLPPLPPSTADFGLSTSTMSDEPRQSYPLPEPPVDEEVPSNSESVFTNPPTVFVEAETPDPFLIDEEGDALSEDEDSSAAVSQLTVSPAHDVPLDLPPASSPEPDSAPRQAPTSPLPNLNKDVPPPPSSESEQEDEIPDLYVPMLIMPTMFLPIPNVRLPLFAITLTWWLCRNSMYSTLY
jgi:hypothetical protein